MEPTILDKIISGIAADEQSHFDSFNADKFILKRGSDPLNVLKLVKENFFFICECKKGSPSMGEIVEDYDPVKIAVDYEKSGAGAISVITEKNFFMGHPDHLRAVRQEVSIPVLRKDFVFHKAQVYESYNMGADLVLLIAACLSDDKLKELHSCILMLGMTPLVEIHNEEELNRVKDLPSMLLGINNRNLKTFEVNLNTCLDLKKMISAETPVIAESGISSNKEIVQLKEAGFAGVLVGTSLLQQNNISSALNRLING